jgi:hypothetical protein
MTSFLQKKTCRRRGIREKKEEEGRVIENRKEEGTRKRKREAKRGKGGE